MPQSSVKTFADPDDYVTAIRASSVEFSRMEKGSFVAELVQIDLGRLWLQGFSESLARLAHHATVPDRIIVGFTTQSNSCLRTDGREMRHGALLRYGEGFSGFQRSIGPAQFGTLALPIAGMEDFAATFGSVDFQPSRETLIVHPALAAMETLQKTYAAAVHLAKQVPEVIANGEVARGLEQTLISALADCFHTAATPHDKTLRPGHKRIMQGFHTILESDPTHVFYVPEICRRLGVSNRTLTTCCNDALGVSPHRYLRLRQLNLAHRALKLADPATRSVTEIATEHGFWELGRFAVAYRALYGETPSATLRRAPSIDAAPRVSGKT